MRPWHLIPFVLASACAEAPNQVFLDLDSLGFDFALLIPVDGGNKPVTDAQLLDLTDPAPLNIDSEGLATLVVLGFTREVLRDATPRLADARIGTELELLGSTPQTPEGMVSESGIAVDVQLPADTEVLTAAADDDFALKPTTAGAVGLEEAGLRLPVDIERCGPEASITIRSFTENVGVVQNPNGVEMEMRGTFRLNDDAIIAAAQRYLVYLERGRRFVHTAETSLDLGEDYVVTGLAGIRTPEGIRIAVTGFEGSINSNRQGSLRTTRFRPGVGFEPFVELASSPYKMDDVLFDENGRLVAVARPGRVVILETEGSTLTEASFFGGDQKQSRIYLTGLADRPYAIAGGNTGLFHFGSPDARQWTPASEGLSETDTPRGFGRRAEEELFTSNTQGRLYRRTLGGDEYWSEQALRLPPSYNLVHGCGVNDAGDGWFQPRASLLDIQALGSVPDAPLVAVPAECGTLLVINNRCATYVPLRAAGTSAGANKKVVRDGDVLTVSTAEHGIFEVSLP